MKRRIEQRLRIARDGFLRQSLSPTPRGLRPHFDMILAPVPRLAHSQWDFGDMTSRALIDWLLIRQVLGPDAVDTTVESGLWRHLESFLHPETGLAFVPDHSVSPGGPYYYHMWDQGMMFHLLVLTLLSKSDAGPDRRLTLERIRRLQAGLQHKARRTVLHDRQGLPGLVADFSEVLWWPTDGFWDDATVFPSDRDFGAMHWIHFTFVAGLLLRPQAALAALTGEERDVKLAIELAGGFLCGFEEVRGSTSPMFDPGGRFKGHFHGAVTGLIGVVELGRYLLDHGDAAQGERLIALAIQVYRWIFDFTPGSNPNAACSCGYFPETIGYGPRAGVTGVTELCCTADVIELAAALAACHTLRSAWRGLADLWDDIERFTVNEVFHTQFTDPERLLPRLDRMRGVWAGFHSFPCDVAWYQTAAGVAKQIPELDLTEVPAVVPLLSAAGCCAYSGVRALCTAWKESVCTAPGRTEVRIVTSHEDANVEIQPLSEGGLSYRARGAHTLRVRLPARVDRRTVRFSGVASAVPDPASPWVELDLAAGTAGAVRWEIPVWTSAEKVGCINHVGAWPDLPANDTPRYRLQYRGNALVAIEPPGLAFPYLEGL